jgi:hypothetical protein
VVFFFYGQCGSNKRGMQFVLKSQKDSFHKTKDEKILLVYFVEESMKYSSRQYWKPWRGSDKKIKEGFEFLEQMSNDRNKFETRTGWLMLSRLWLNFPNSNIYQRKLLSGAHCCLLFWPNSMASMYYYMHSSLVNL